MSSAMHPIKIEYSAQVQNTTRNGLRESSPLIPGDCIVPGFDQETIIAIRIVSGLPGISCPGEIKVIALMIL